MIKSSVVRKDVLRPRFPKLMSNIEQGYIALISQVTFNSLGLKGVIVWAGPDSPARVGDRLAEFVNLDNFEDFHGSVTLTNGEDNG